MGSRATEALKRIWRATHRNLLWKLLSLLCAFILWSYVVSGDTRNTQSRYIAFKAADIGVVGTKDIANWSLALLSDPNDVFGEVRVRVDVNRANYSRVSGDNVQLELDLSRIRQSGVREVRLSATSTYGRVTEIVPPTVTVEIDQLDSRSVPITVEYVGQKEGYSYSTRSTSPQYVSVSGPLSIVRKVRHAYVALDVSDYSSPVSQTELVALVDSDMNGIAHPQLLSTPSAVIVNALIYPEKSVPVDAESAVIGAPEEGYRVASVTVRPDRITVSGDEELLDGIDRIYVEPIDVEGKREMAPVHARIQTRSGVAYASAEVLVEIAFERIPVEASRADVPIAVAGAGEAFDYSLSFDFVEVRYPSFAGAPPSPEVSAGIDVSGLKEGVYRVPIVAYAEGCPGAYAFPRSVWLTVTAK